MPSFRRTLQRATCFELGWFVIVWGRGDLVLTRSLLEQFRQPGEINRNLSRLLDHRDAGMSCSVRVGLAAENAELSTTGVLDGKTVWDFDDPPRLGKTAGHGAGSCRFV